ncbi:hypothetical protein ACFQZV_13580 [Microbacterium koreense]|uniref:Uncharacterized protein n=1 Tax=Microbacterium koreense TaxID=323761 RepID=A0ABW2ZVK8_9MICO
MNGTDNAQRRRSPQRRLARLAVVAGVALAAAVGSVAPPATAAPVNVAPAAVELPNLPLTPQLQQFLGVATANSGSAFQVSNYQLGRNGTATPDWSGNIAMPGGTSARFDFSNVDLYADRGIVSRVTNPASGTSGSRFFPDQSLTTSPFANAYVQDVPGMIALNAELAALKAQIALLASDHAGIIDDDGISGNQTINVDLFDTNGDGIAVFDIGDSGTDMTIEGVLTITGTGSVFPIFRVADGITFEINNGTIQTAGGLAQGSDVGALFVMADADGNGFKASNGVVQRVGLYDLTLSGDSELDFSNVTGCGQFVAPTHNWSNVRLRGCTFSNVAPEVWETTVLVEKGVIDVDGDFLPGQGWTVGVAPTVTAGVVTSIPAVPTQTTDGNGYATWTLEYDGPTASADLTISETQQPGFELDTSASVCSIADAGPAARIPNGEVSITSTSVQLDDVGPGKTIVCYFQNRQIPGAATVDKALVGTPDPGAQVRYEVTLTHTGVFPAVVDFTDDLSGVLDDATFVDGSISLSPAESGITAQFIDDPISPTLTLTGSIGPDPGVVIVSYDVVIGAAGTLGDGILDNCVAPDAGGVPVCTSDPVNAELTLEKVVLGQEPLDTWTLSADAPSPARPGPSGASGTTSATAVVSPSTAYTLNESDGPATYVQVGDWVCTDAAGADIAVVAAEVTLSPGAAVTCAVTNGTASITLLKSVVSGTAVPADWTLTATPATLAGLTASSVVGADVASASTTFEARPGHSYTLAEALTDEQAPLAYRLARLEVQNPDGTWSVVTEEAITAPPAGASVVYRFVNEPIPTLSLPLTGGAAADAFVIVGAGILAGAFVALIILRVRRRTVVLDVDHR